jgi:NADH:ubiquinone oxidoreductase subunit F (NADH-binding)
MTTICPLGPSSTAPVASILRYFRDEVEALIPTAEVARA